MDRIVKEAMAKWPNVPSCTGWLALDRRGRFRMRDEACQAADAPGEPIRHAALNAFIARNYTCDADGRWFFQNGPQRVFVDLDYAPLVVRLHHGTAEYETQAAGSGGADAGAGAAGNTTVTRADTPTAVDSHPVLIDQCGLPFVPSACWCDEQGSILFAGRRGRRAESAMTATQDTLAHRQETNDETETVALLYDQDLDLFLTLFPNAADKMAALLETAPIAAYGDPVLHDMPAGAPSAAATEPGSSAGHHETDAATLLWPASALALPCDVIHSTNVPARFGFHLRPVA